MRWIGRPLLVYAAFAIVTTWPLVLHPSSRLGAPAGPGDPFLYLWVLGWVMHAVLHDPMSILNGSVFNANIFHPALGTLSYSDHLLLQAVVLSPVYAVTGDVTLCYNALLLVSLVACALAMHAFVREVVGTDGGAYVAGLTWGFGSFHFAHLLHVQLQALYFLPLTFLFVHRLLAGRRVRDAVWLGLAVGLQAVSSAYYAVIGGVGLLVGTMVLLLSIRARWDRGLVKRFIVAGALAAALVLPLAVVYLRVQQSEGFGRGLFEASGGAAYASSYLQVPPGNVIYGRTDLLRDHREPPPGAPSRTGPERELFPGFIVVVLAAIGIWGGWRSERPLVLAMTTVAVAGFVLSLGPDGIRPLYSALHRYVFGFQAIRAPARFSVLVLFGLSALAAIGWREVRANARLVPRGRAPAVAVAVTVAVAIELLHLPVTLAAAPPWRTDIGQWLLHQPGPGAVVVLPLTIDIENTPAMVQSLEHRRPLLNGYSGQRPQFYPSLVDALNGFPSDESLLALLESDVRFVVAPRPVDTNGGPSPLVERARFADGTIYELQWTPDLEARVRQSGVIEPPQAGPPPFHAGESATYTVTWNGAGNVTAGTVTMRVDGPAYRFIVSADSATWIARFYELHAVLATTADRALMPSRQERQLREGPRTMNRVYEFDTARGVIRLGQSLEDARSRQGVVLPLAAHARDAITALYYARTLPMTPGARYRFPVNDAGRNSVVELKVAGVETITVGGQPRAAIRIEPQIEHRVARRAEPTAVIWLDAAPSHVPLALDVDAAFGRVRIELTKYEPGAGEAGKGS